MDKVKPFDISKREVWEAFKRVKANRGAAGVDGQSIAQFEEDLSNNLYRLWNRLSSGSYVPPPVRRVEIPKADGTTRPLGIPTVSDRIAQMVVRRYLEPILEPVFHDDSYGYRPRRSAHQALTVARQRCWRSDWVLDLDIKGFLDRASQCPLVYEECSKRSVWSLTALIRKPLRRPLQTRTASSSPRFTRCNTV
jgi:RNA-directed DNA polymerase